MLGYVIVGTIVGFMTFIAAMILGSSAWLGLMLYSLAGSIVVIVLAVAELVIGRTATRDGVTSSGAETGQMPKPRFSGPAADHSYFSAEPQKASMRILAVDDDPFILELIPMIASKAGFSDVTAAASGQHALEALANGGKTFDCLLLDISMPSMDGIELCVHIRAIPAYRETPIIMLTAMKDMKYVDHAFKAGATDYLTKPFDISELGVRLRSAQTLISARKQTTLSLVHASHAAQSHSFELACDEIHIKGAVNLVSRAVLANYLIQLPRTALADAQVIAVKIDRIDVIFARTSSQEFIAVIKDVADALRDIFGTYRTLMTYTGDGSFLIVSRGTTWLEPINIETEIKKRLDDCISRNDNGEPLGIEISVGESIRPNIAKAQNASIAFDDAITFAKARELRKKIGVLSQGIRLVK
ncbi:MAG: response regulator [Sideroxyarcus sp.]|nr:response regulator [Sideroxyarcus sp.]